MEIFGKELKLRTHYCQKNNCNDLYQVKDPYINIYVKLTELCQARCKFCEFCDGSDTWFDEYKMYYVLQELQKKVIVNKISFTGGEPTINLGKFQMAVRIAREACPKAFINVNTNGYNLDEIQDMPELDCIALSRHHYDDEKNAKLFGSVTIPNTDEIKNLRCKDKMHFSCNLVKGYIDNEEEICKYLDKSAELGIMDVGFVTMMKVNPWCEEHHVDFRDIEFSDNHKMINTQIWKSGDVCECRNYLYNPLKVLGVVKVYARYNYEPDKSLHDGNLVYDGQNLKKGFKGDIII